MDNITPTFYEHVDKLYDKSTYLDKYGGSVIVSCLTLFVFFLLFSYYYIQTHLKPIKADWVNQKCNPSVVPFAGLINAPPGESKFEYTANNFSECTTSILSEIIGMFTQPIHFLSNITSEFFVLLGEAIQKIRELFSKIRMVIISIIENVMYRINNVLIQLQVLTIKIKKVLGKSQAVMTTGLYTIMASYLAMKSFFGAMLEIIIVFLSVLAAIIFAAWWFIGTWPFAAGATAVFLTIAIPTGIIAGWLGHILELTTSNIPNAPSRGCFDENTEVEMKNGNLKKIIDIELGDILKDNSIVTGLFKIKRGNKKIYNLNDVIVTGCHDIYYHDTWISVEDHPEKREIMDYSKQFVYCLNTSSKEIILNNMRFADWDEVDETDIINLKYIFNQKIRNPKDIHKYLEGGFDGDTLVELHEGHVVQLKNLKINNKLKSGETIVGIVEISTENIETIKKYEINNAIFIGGPNLVIKDKYLGKFNTLNMGTPIQFDNNKLYQFITNTGKITINGVKFFDYNGGLEQLLWQEKKTYEYL